VREGEIFGIWLRPTRCAPVLDGKSPAEGAANANVTIESLIAEAEAARVKAMSEKGDAAAAVTALTAKAKLAGRQIAEHQRDMTATGGFRNGRRIRLSSIAMRAAMTDPVPPRSRTKFPPEGIVVESWYVAMGLGHVVTLRVPPARLREVNRGAAPLTTR
jgi:hypothetical protein